MSGSCKRFVLSLLVLIGFLPGLGHAQADLSITLVDAPDPVIAGTNLTYTATVSNAGPSASSQVVVSLPTPGNTTFVSGSVSGGGSCLPGGCTVSGSIASGASRTVTLVYAVSAGATNGSQILASASASAGTSDPNGSNNTASTTTTVGGGEADLSAGLTLNQASVAVGDPLIATGTLTNLGPEAASNAAMRFSIPPQLSFVSASPSGGGSCSGTSTVTCTWAGNTAPSGVRTAAVTMTAITPADTSVLLEVFSATPDSSTGNNFNGASVTVVAGVSPQLSVSSSSGTAGGTASPVTVVNFTRSPTRAVANFRARVTFVATSLTATAQGGSGGTCTVSQAGGFVEVTSPSGSDLPTGTYCEITFAISPDAPGGNSPLNLQINTGGLGCFNAAQQPVSCTVSAGQVTITAAPNVAPAISYSPQSGSQIFHGSNGLAQPIVATPSGGSGSGAQATTTVGACSISGVDAQFWTSTTIPQLSFVGATTTPQDIVIPACSPGALPRTATLTCPESRGGGAPSNRTWTLNCPAGVVVAPVLSISSSSGGVGTTALPANVFSFSRSPQVPIATFRTRVNFSPANLTASAQGANGASCTVNQASGFVEVVAPSGSNDLPSGTYCTISFAINSGASTGDSPLTLQNSSGNLGCFASGNLLQNCSLSDGQVTINPAQNVPPGLSYSPAAGSSISYAANGSANAIVVTPSGGSGSGGSATTTLGPCSITGGGSAFPTTTIAQLSFVGSSTAAQAIVLPGCQPGQSAVTAILSCPESAGGGAPQNRSWSLLCPSAAGAVNPALSVGSASGTVGGSLSPSSVPVSLAASASRPIRGFSARVAYDAARFSVMATGSNGASCTVNASSGFVSVSVPNAASNLGSGTYCSLAFAMTAGTPAGNYPLTLQTAFTGGGCFDASGNVDCTLNSGLISITGGAATGPSLTYDPPAGTSASNAGIVNFTGVGGVGSIGLGRISITPTGGSGSASTTLIGFSTSGTDANAFSLSGGGPLSFAAGSATQTLTLSCIAGNSARMALLQATESVSGGASTQRFWLLNCPAAGAPSGPLDEPSASNVLLPLPSQPGSCPGGFFISSVGDGPGGGITNGIFGFELLLEQPGSRLLEGGLNFGGLIDAGQAGFAGFNFTNPANEQQRLTMTLTGSPSSDRNGSLPVQVSLIRQTTAGNQTVFQASTPINLASPYIASVNLTPGFYVATVTPTGGSIGGSPEGQFFLGMETSFVNRPGGGFQGGAVVGGYHAAHPFGGVSGFAAFCLGMQHRASARVLSAPTYGVTGARDLRLVIVDQQQNPIVAVPSTSGGGNASPVAQFTVTVLGLTASFVSTSSDPDGTIATHRWSFGDGSTSSERNPVKNYSAPGVYEVELQVTDNAGATATTRQQISLAGATNAPPLASFDVSVSGLDVSFLDTSRDADGQVVAWRWEFGDGSTSNLRNPTRTYANGGVYTVNLTVTDDAGATALASRTLNLDSPPAGNQLLNGVTVSGSTNSSSINSDYRDYFVQLPANVGTLTIQTSNAGGDVDLYVRYGAEPDTSSFDCRPFLVSGNETCSYAPAASGVYYIRVYGYQTGLIPFDIRASW